MSTPPDLHCLILEDSVGATYIFALSMSSLEIFALRLLARRLVQSTATGCRKRRTALEPRWQAPALNIWSHQDGPGAVAFLRQIATWSDLVSGPGASALFFCITRERGGWFFPRMFHFRSERVERKEELGVEHVQEFPVNAVSHPAIRSVEGYHVSTAREGGMSTNLVTDGLPGGISVPVEA